MKDIYREQLDRLYSTCHTQGHKIAFICLTKIFQDAINDDLDFTGTPLEQRSDFLGIPVIIDETLDGCFELIWVE